MITFCDWCKLLLDSSLGDWGFDPGSLIIWLDDALGIGGGISNGGGGGKISDQFGTYGW